MKFKPGDIVIRPTGGNKMSVIEIVSNRFKCICVDDKSISESIFNEDEIVSLSEYRNRIIKKEERADKIDRILNGSKY